MCSRAGARTYITHMEDFAKDISYGELESGIRVVARRTASEVAYVGLMMNTGSRDAKPGLAHFVEHTLFKGTDTRTARQLIEETESVGGEMNAYTTKEETTLYTTVLAEYAERALALMADMVLHSAFPEQELKKEREVILDEIDSYLDSPSEQIFDNFEDELFEGLSIGAPILGSKQQVRALKGKTAWEYVHRCYNVDEMVLFCQGPISLEQVLEWGNRYLPAGLPLTKRDWVREVPTEVARRHLTQIRTDHQTHVMMGGCAYPLGHKNRLGMYLLTNILGGPALSSRLNLALREQEGLVYEVESNLQSMTDCGYWCIYFGCDDKDRDRCLELTENCLEQLKREQLTSLQLDRYKQQLRGQLAIGAENQESVALGMAKSHLHFNRVRNWRQTMAKFEKITSGELLEIAREVF